MAKLFDWPPLWLVLFLALVWGIGHALPWPLFGAAGRAVAAVLAVAGIALMLAAVVQMLARRTTVIPRQQAAALVTGGVFRLSRNPIYLGDALVLAAAVLWWDVPLALPLVPVFMALIQARFILGEEAGLRAGFATEYAEWAARVRRWL